MEIVRKMVKNYPPKFLKVKSHFVLHSWDEHWVQVQSCGKLIDVYPALPRSHLVQVKELKCCNSSQCSIVMQGQDTLYSVNGSCESPDNPEFDFEASLQKSVTRHQAALISKTIPYQNDCFANFDRNSNLCLWRQNCLNTQDDQCSHQFDLLNTIDFSSLNLDCPFGLINMTCHQPSDSIYLVQQRHLLREYELVKVNTEKGRYERRLRLEGDVKGILAVGNYLYTHTSQAISLIDLRTHQVAARLGKSECPVGMVRPGSNWDIEFSLGSQIIKSDWRYPSLNRSTVIYNHGSCISDFESVSTQNSGYLVVQEAQTGHVIIH